MNENENENVVVNPNEDYLETIKEMKKNSVSKEEYNKLREENRKLLSSLVNGEEIEVDSNEEEEEAPKRTREEIIKSIDDNCSSLFVEDNSMSNLECAKRIIKYHDDMIELTGNDPFENTGDKFIASDSDKSSPKKTYEYLKNCVEQSQDDPVAFNVAFQAGLRQILPLGGKKK